MKPGFKTSEFWLAVFKVLVTATVALCGLFGVGVPTWVRPDAPWIATAALVVGGAVTIFYSRGRTSVKRAVALSDMAVASAVATTEPAPVTPAAPPATAGYTLIGLLVWITALILAAIGAYLLIVGAVVSHALSATGLILLIIGIILAVVGRSVEGGGRLL